MARYKLDLAPSPEVQIIGISSHVSDHRLCWSLNRHLGLDLERCRTDIEEQRSDGRWAFATFEYRMEEAHARYTLVSNRCPGAILMPEERRTDFFLLVDGDDPVVPDDLVERVRGAELVLAAYPLTLDRLRSGHKLIR